MRRMLNQESKPQPLPKQRMELNLQPQRIIKAHQPPPLPRQRKEPVCPPLTISLVSLPSQSRKRQRAEAALSQPKGLGRKLSRKRQQRKVPILDKRRHLIPATIVCFLAYISKKDCRGMILPQIPSTALTTIRG